MGCGSSTAAGNVKNEPQDAKGKKPAEASQNKSSASASASASGGAAKKAPSSSSSSTKTAAGTGTGAGAAAGTGGAASSSKAAASTASGSGSGSGGGGASTSAGDDDFDERPPKVVKKAPLGIATTAAEGEQGAGEEEGFAMATVSTGEHAGRPRKSGTKYVKGAKPPPNNSVAPTHTLEIEWAYGYRIADTRNNLKYLANGSMVWHTGALGVVYNPVTHTQTFFRGHTDDIVSLALHPDGKTVATGQVGKTPNILIWNAETLEQISDIKGRHTDGGVCGLSFSGGEGRLLVSCGMDDAHLIVVSDWYEEAEVAWAKGSASKIYGVEFNSFNENEFVSYGVRHITFWTISGTTIKSKQGTFGISEPVTVLDASYQAANRLYAAGSAGSVLVFVDGNCEQAMPGHTGAVFITRVFGTTLYSGGMDGTLRVWDAATGAAVRNHDISAAAGNKDVQAIRSIFVAGANMLVGLKNSVILGMTEKCTDIKKIHEGHSIGELWGLACHPSRNEFVTCSDDLTLRLWNVESRTLTAMTTAPHQLRSAAYSPDGSQLACGTLVGGVIIYEAATLTQVTSWAHRKEEVAEVKYSPCGRYLAVGTHDNVIDVYNVATKFSKVATCSGNSSFITHLDWAKDSSVILSNSGDYELLFYSPTTGKQIFIKKEDLLANGTGPIEDLRWATWTGVLSDVVIGHWPADSDGTDVNALDLNVKHKIFATGDDFGKVKLFPFPSTDEFARNNAYGGHSAHVTNVRWTFDEDTLVSVGGGDQTIIQWKLKA